MNRSESENQTNRPDQFVSDSEIAEFNFCNVSWFFSRNDIRFRERRGTMPYNQYGYTSMPPPGSYGRMPSKRASEISISIIAAVIGIVIMIALIFF